MTEKLCLFACRNFMPDVASVVTAEGWTDVEVAAFPARCGRPPLAWDELRPQLPKDCTQLVVLGSVCLRGLGDSPSDFPPIKIEKVAQCFHLVAGRKLVDETIGSGGYLMTPTWLAEWRKHIGEMGVEPGHLDEFFQDFAKELVLLDTGIDAKSVTNLTELQREINLNTRRIPIGLDHLKLFLSKVVLEYQFEKERRFLTERERLNKIKLADHVSAMDMLMRLSKIQDEDRSIEAIKEMFNMLFAPEALYYLKVEHDIPVPTQSIPAEMQASMLEIQDDYVSTPNGRGFLLRIKHGDELLGIIGVDQLAFPEYRSRYINMALAVTGVFALVVKNSREFAEHIRVEKEKQVLEKQLIQAQKLESLGILAGGIAHDFNNILMAVTGHTDLALLRLSAESPAVHNLQQIQIATKKAADLAGQMLAYSGKGRFVIERLNLNRMVEEMTHLLEVSISKKARMHFDFSTKLPAVEADATQLRQVIMNLIINASEALGEKSGVIAVSTGVVNCDRDCLDESWFDDSLNEGLYVYLEVTDTGCGMDKATLDRIYDPFFSTKFTGRGLGLAATLGITRGHKGMIKVDSEVGQGTSFRVLLPKADEPVDVRDDAESDSVWQDSRQLLLVDDEAMVLAVGKAMLEGLGSEVLTASNGCEAVAHFKEHSDTIGKIVMDLTMPHMGGEEAFGEMRQLDPGVK